MAAPQKPVPLPTPVSQTPPEDTGADASLVTGPTGQQQLAPRKQVFRDKKTGSYWVWEGAGTPQASFYKIRTVQQLMDLEVSQRDQVDLATFGTTASEPNVMGVKPGERTFIRNFVTDPEAAKQGLRARGYVVRSFGPGWDFMVKPKGRPNVPWRGFDPKGAKNLKEAGFDVLDLLYDAGQAAATTGAAAIGGPLAAGGVGYETELLRQQVARSAGFNERGGEATAAMTGLASMIPTPAVGRGIRGTGRMASELEGELGGMLTSARGGGALSRADVFHGRVVSGVPAKEKVESLASAARGFLNKVKGALPNWDDPQSWAASRIPELRQADDIANSFGAVTVDMTQLETDLAELTLPNPLTMAEQNVMIGQGKVMPKGPFRSLDTLFRVGKEISEVSPEHAGKTLDTIRRIRETAGVTDPSKVPVPLAIRLRRMLDDRAKSIGGLDDKAKERASVEVHEKLRGELNSAIKERVDAAMVARGDTGPSYSALMAEGARKLSQWNSFLEKSGAKEYARGIDRSGATDKAVSYLGNLHGFSKSASMEELREVEARTGLNLLDPAMPAIIGTRIGDEGAMGLLPKVTATGQVPGFAGTVLGGAQLITGMTPRNIVRAGQMTHLLGGNGQFAPVSTAQRVADAMGRYAVKPISQGTMALLKPTPSQAALALALQNLMRGAVEPSADQGSGEIPGSRVDRDSLARPIRRRPPQ